MCETTELTIRRQQLDPLFSYLYYIGIDKRENISFVGLTFETKAENIILPGEKAIFSRNGSQQEKHKDAQTGKGE